MSNVKILLAEDDVNLGNLLRDYLILKNYDPVLCTNGNTALEAFASGSFSLCILDIMMPEMDGLTLAREIRLTNTEIPVIFLTARNQQEDILEGFRSGADDYITKPFSMEELVFRIEAILRRTSSTAFPDRKEELYNIGQYTFFPGKQLLVHNGVPVKLTTKESELLCLLCKQGNDILERNFTLKTIWVDDNYFNARSMDVYITRLRKYLRKDPSVKILNIHGKGYKLIR
jgi:DNA-binding response OmpR family regulator